jgi:hypothetical protein
MLLHHHKNSCIEDSYFWESGSTKCNKDGAVTATAGIVSINSLFHNQHMFAPQLQITRWSIDLTGKLIVL